MDSEKYIGLDVHQATIVVAVMVSSHDCFRLSAKNSGRTFRRKACNPSSC